MGRIVVNNKGVVGSIPDSHQFTFGLLVNATYSLHSYTLVRNTVFKTLLLFNVDRVFFVIGNPSKYHLSPISFLSQRAALSQFQQSSDDLGM